MSFSPDGRQVLASFAEGAAYVWDAETGQEIQRFEGHIRKVIGAEFSADGRFVVSSSTDGDDMPVGSPQRQGDPPF